MIRTVIALILMPVIVPACALVIVAHTVLLILVQRRIERAQESFDR